MNTGNVEPVRLDKRQKILLDIIDNFSNALDHPTSALLHEYILLCQLKSKRKPFALQSYDFHAYMRGPYSEELRDDLEKLYGLDLIEVREGGIAVTARGKDIINKNRKGEDYNTAIDTCLRVLKDFDTAPAISEGIFNSISKVSLGEVIR